jgi:hypothetical protein
MSCVYDSSVTSRSLNRIGLTSLSLPRNNATDPARSCAGWTRRKTGRPAAARNTVGVDGWLPVPLNEHILALDPALSKLAALDSRAARLVELRFLSGLEEDEVAAVLSVFAITVKKGLEGGSGLAGRSTSVVRRVVLQTSPISIQRRLPSNRLGCGA